MPVKLRHCGRASYLDGYFLCQSSEDCDYQIGSGLTFYCGRKDANDLLIKIKKDGFLK